MAKTKKLFAVLLIVSLLIMSASPAYAATAKKQSSLKAGGVSIMWTYISTVLTWMDIDAYGEASMAASMDAYAGVTSIKITSYLQRYSGSGWTPIKSWTQTFSGTYGTWTQTYYVSSGYLYRLRSYFYAYVGTTMVESTNLISGIVDY